MPVMPPDQVVALANNLAHMLTGLGLHKKGISFTLLLCNDNPDGSFAHYITNTTRANAIGMMTEACHAARDHDKKPEYSDSTTRAMLNLTVRDIAPGSKVTSQGVDYVIVRPSPTVRVDADFVPAVRLSDGALVGLNPKMPAEPAAS